MRRRHWLGWGLALLILPSCAFLVDLRQLGRALLTLTPGAITGLLLLATADRLLMGYKWSAATDRRRANANARAD